MLSQFAPRAPPSPPASGPHGGGPIQIAMGLGKDGMGPSGIVVSPPAPHGVPSITLRLGLPCGDNFSAHITRMMHAGVVGLRRAPGSSRAVVWATHHQAPCSPSKAPAGGGRRCGAETADRAHSVSLLVRTVYPGAVSIKEKEPWFYSFFLFCDLFSLWMGFGWLAMCLLGTGSHPGLPKPIHPVVIK